MRVGYEVFHPDVHTVERFYVDVLGFETGQRGDDYLTVKRDDLTIGCARDERASLERRKPPVGCEIVLRVDDVHAELERVEKAGWPVEDPLQERPWGMTDFRLFDPTGLYIRVTGP